MATGTPIVRQIAWLAVIPQLAALALGIGIALLLAPRNGVYWGAGVYLLYSTGARQLITRDHRAGISLLKQQCFEAAIPYFRKSLEFLDRHPWIDRFRSIVLMSASAASYREMALANIAFCYSQMGRGQEARSYYEQCLQRFPDSGLATAALRMLDTGSGSNDQRHGCG